MSSLDDIENTAKRKRTIRDGKILHRLLFASVQIKAQLAEIFRFKSSHLEFHGDEAVEAAMKEEQVQCEVPRTYLQRKLGTDKAEVSAKLQHESFMRSSNP